MRHALNKGTRVQRIHPYDGSACSGLAYGPILVVQKLRDHVPCNGPGERNAIVVLSGGSWEFAWNVKEVLSEAKAPTLMVD